MTPQGPDVPPTGWADAPSRATGPLGALPRFLGQTLVLTELEARRLRHDPTELVSRAVQPALWLLVAGPVFAKARMLSTPDLNYVDFMAPGVLAQGVLFSAIFYGVAIIWERDLGIVHKFLVTPVYRSALVLGKALSAGLRGLVPALIIYLLALLLGVRLAWHPLALAGVLAAVALGAAVFCSFSLIIACLVKTRERFMGIGQLMTMPLFFASNAIYPVERMPPWLQTVARFNPLTYEVDALRTLMLRQSASSYGLAFDFAVLAALLTLLVLVGARLYPRVAR